MYFFDAKLNYSHHPSGIILICWFATQEKMLLNIFANIFFFFQNSLMNKMFKNSICMKLKSFVRQQMSLLSLLISVMHPG